MGKIKDILTTIDLFGITISFRYKNRKRYQTPLGGFFLLLFVVVLFVLGIYYFIPFVNRKNFTVVYYTMNLASTEEIDLFASESNIAFGISCSNNENEKLNIEDILDLKMKYIIYIKNIDGTYDKDPQDLDIHSCTYSDFFNKYNKQMDYLGLQKFKCISKKNYIIQGIFSDQIFSYFEISLLSKNKSAELINEIERFLFENDCKLNIAFIDIIIDLDNYANPMTQFLNEEIFIQLDPVYYTKMNVYFMNQEFADDNYFFLIFGDEDDLIDKRVIYSREEEYAVWKGFNRSLTKTDSYNYFSKIYLRADVRKKIIKRRYQKFAEYFSESVSMLMGIYEILVVIFYFLYNFSAYYYLSKEIFFFKDFDVKNNFNFHKKIRQIEDLLNITDLNSKSSEINVMEEKKEDSKLNYNGETKKDINIYSNKKKLFDKQKKFLSLSLPKNNESNIYKNYSKDFSNQKQKQYNDYAKNKFNEEIQKSNMNLNRRNKSNEYSRYQRNSDRYKINSDGSIGTNMDSSFSGSEKPKRKKRLVYSFNVFEMVFFTICNCCLKKNSSLKNYINEKANNILFKKIDIITYIRNIILFECINTNNIDADKIPIYNFLCHPIISLNKREKNKFDDLYRTYKEKDFNKFSQQISEVAKKRKDNGKEIILLSLSHEHLKKLI